MGVSDGILYGAISGVAGSMLASAALDPELSIEVVRNIVQMANNESLGMALFEKVAKHPIISALGGAVVGRTIEEIINQVALATTPERTASVSKEIYNELRSMAKLKQGEQFTEKFAIVLAEQKGSEVIAKDIIENPFTVMDESERNIAMEFDMEKFKKIRQETGCSKMLLFHTHPIPDERYMFAYMSSDDCSAMRKVVSHVRKDKSLDLEIFSAIATSDDLSVWEFLNKNTARRLNVNVDGVVLTLPPRPYHHFVSRDPVIAEDFKRFKKIRGNENNQIERGF